MNVIKMNAAAEGIMRAAQKECPENPVAALFIALMRAGRDSGMLDEEVCAVLANLQKANPKKVM